MFNLKIIFNNLQLMLQEDVPCFSSGLRLCLAHFLVPGVYTGASVQCSQAFGEEGICGLCREGRQRRLWLCASQAYFHIICSTSFAVASTSVGSAYTFNRKKVDHGSCCFPGYPSRTFGERDLWMVKWVEVVSHNSNLPRTSECELI